MSYLDFERNDLQSNYYIYRNEVLVEHIENVQDGIYHLYVLKADRTIGTEFVYDKFSQNVVDLYPQLDKDNFDDNPPSAFSYARRSPIGDVITNRLKNSIDTPRATEASSPAQTPKGYEPEIWEGSISRRV